MNAVDASSLTTSPFPLGSLVSMGAPVDPNRRAGAVGPIVHGPRERIAGAVYGTIVVLGVLAAGSDSASIDAWELDVLMVATVLVLWVAHVYAHALAASLASGLRLDAAAITSLARREIPIVLAAVGPALVLLLGVFGLVTDEAAAWLAVGVGSLTLAIMGFRYARIASLGLLGTILVVAANLSLALLIAALKVAVEH